MSQQKSGAPAGTGQPHNAAAQVSQAPASQGSAAASADSASSGPPPAVYGTGTINFIPLWTGRRVIGNSILSQTAAGLNVAGGVTATSFSGDGSAVTNVNAATLGGLGSSVFAQQDTSNQFTGNQTITGNLTLTGSIDDALTLQGNLSDAEEEEGANIIGGFGGDSSYPGNSVAPGVIGATIAGGGGAADTTSLPSHNRRGRGAAKARPPQFGVTSIFQTVTANWGTIGGGGSNTASGIFSVVAGGYKNTASNTYATVGGGDQNTASGTESVVGGGTSNTASGYAHTTVGGGYSNTAGDENAIAYGDTVAGGENNLANSAADTINFDSCVTSGFCQATVAGGWGNHATSGNATVGGGYANTAAGPFSTVPGGWANTANGYNSFAAGYGATANYNGSFVWSDDLNSPADTGTGQFVATASGGFFFYTGGSFGTYTGATLPSGSGSWSSVSDRNVKDNFAIIDGESLLTKIAALPISTWNYKTQATSIRHMGPTAQDFRTAFGLGEDEKHISNIDSEGVALAAIQALYKLNQEKDGKIAELSQALEQLKTEVDTLKDSSRKH
jgi:hypothetical protein